MIIPLLFSSLCTDADPNPTPHIVLQVLGLATEKPGWDSAAKGQNKTPAKTRVRNTAGTGAGGGGYDAQTDAPSKNMRTDEMIARAARHRIGASSGLLADTDTGAGTGSAGAAAGANMEVPELYVTSYAGTRGLHLSDVDMVFILQVHQKYNIDINRTISIHTYIYRYSPHNTITRSTRV